MLVYVLNALIILLFSINLYAGSDSLINPGIVSAPSKPIAKTIVGSVLFGDGVVSLAFGIPYLVKGAREAGDFGEAIQRVINLGTGLAAVITGAGALLSGGILLSSARPAWHEYREWEARNKLTLNSSGNVFISLKFDF